MDEKKRKPSFLPDEPAADACLSNGSLMSLISVLHLTVTGRAEFKRRYIICELAKRPQDPDFREQRTQALSILSLNENVISTCNEAGDFTVWDQRRNPTYVLIRNSGNGMYAFDTVRQLSRELADYAILNRVESDAVFADEALKFLPVKLLLNGMLRGSAQAKGLLENSTCVNLMSDLIIFRPDWSEIARNTKEYVSLYGIKIKVDKSGTISAAVVTYSLRHLVLQRLEKAKDKPALKRAMCLPSYMLNENPLCLSPCFGSDHPSTRTFIQRSLHPTRKNNVPECVFSSISTFWNSKQGIISQLIRLFNCEYGDMMTIELEKVTLENCISTNTITRRKEQQKEYLVEQLKENGKICLVNMLGKYDANNEYVPLLEKALTISLDLKEMVLHSAQPVPGYFNIIMDHDKSYYQNLKKDDEKAVVDKYTFAIQKDKSPVIQHVTLETLHTTRKTLKDEYGEPSFEIPEYLALVLFNECIVKSDIINRRLSMPWQRDFGYPIEFAKRFEFTSVRDTTDAVDRKYRYLIISIKESGDFTLESLDADDINMADDMSQALVQLKDDDVAVLQEGRLAVITKAGFRIFNDYDGIERYSDRYGLKNKDARDAFFGGAFELRSFVFRGENYLISGLYKDQIGPSNTINKGIIPRKIEYLTEGASGMEQMLLSQMNNVYISRDRISAYPFPIKYLNEWAKMLLAQETHLELNGGDRYQKGLDDANI